VNELVPTPAGDARVTWYRADTAKAVLALGHGASTGIEAPDLRALAAAVPALGVTVALVEQPWRVASRMGASDTTTLDTAWRAVWPRLAAAGLPVIAGGRSAGSRVAGRTARELGAHAVLALSFPLHAPGRPSPLWDPSELLGTGLPTLIVQGGSDPFGRPAEFPELPANVELVGIPGADHAFGVPGDRGAAMDLIVGSTGRWLGNLL
jgi:hypothetical protein